MYKKEEYFRYMFKKFNTLIWALLLLIGSTLAQDDSVTETPESDDDALLAEIAALTGGDDSEEEESINSNGANGLTLSFSGYNLLQAAKGFKAESNLANPSFFFTDTSVNILNQYNGHIIKPDPYYIKPWPYFQNLFDFSVGVGNFYFHSRFKVVLPSMGLVDNGLQFYEELIDKRTFEYQGDKFTIQTGHFQTSFGRGITLNLNENEFVDKTNLLDGFHISTDFKYLTLQALAGRDKVYKRGIVPVYSFNNQGTIDTSYTSVENKNYRNTIFGVHGESYLFSDIPFLEFMSGSSLGGGIVNFRTNVGDLKVMHTVSNPNDSTVTDKITYFQDRTNAILPSGFFNFATGEFSFYTEYAKMISNEFKHIIDTTNGHFVSDTVIDYQGFNLYTSVNFAIWKFYILLEGINYWYSREINEDNFFDDPYNNSFGPYVDPPEGRYKQKWYLLKKKSAKGKPQNQVGYNVEINFNLNDNTSFIAAYSQNGVHASHALFHSHLETWEVYGEWKQRVKDRLNLNLGFQYGYSEWGLPDLRILTGGLQADYALGDKDHVIGSEIEFQQKATELEVIDKPMGALRAELQNWYNDNNININVDDYSDQEVFSEYDNRIGLEYVKDNPNAINMYAALFYSFSSLFTCKLIFEQETRFFPERPYVFKSEEKTKQQFYKALLLGWKPTEKIDFELGIGTFSERCECSAAGCIIVPAFKGVKLKMNTIF